MTTIHVFQWTAAFLVATALTGAWLLVRPRSRWRHLVTGIVATILWLPVAYTAGNVGVASQGAVVTFGSDALGTVGIFMVVVNIAGLLLGLFLWVEEGVDEASRDLPTDGRARRGD